jgi:uncharacterized membrane protein YbhN (UPF0104 family)
MPPGIVVYALLLSLVSVSARTLLLPVLSLSVAGHPGFGVLWIGSYMLVYSQVVLPVPGGAGAVDLAFLGGMAGQPGPQAPVLLVAWRTYSLGIATALGGALAVHRFGARPLWVLLRSRTTGT